MPGPILILIALLIFLPSYLYSGRILAAGVTSRTRWILSIARMAFLLVVFWLTFRPSARTEELVRVPHRLLLLLDNSASMTLNAENAPDSPSRVDAVKSVVFGRGELLEHFKDAGWEVALFPFSGDDLLSEEDDYQARVPFTDMSAALHKAEQLADNPETDAIVLIGDGCHNEGPVPDGAQSQVAIWTLGVGSDEMPTDLSVTNISAPEFVFQNEPVEVRVTAQASPDVESATMLLSIGEQIVHSATVEFDAGEYIRDFQVQFDLLGEHVVRASVLSDLKEPVTANNSIEMTVRVSKSKTRGLILWGTPDWEFRFIEGALREDRRLVITAMAALPERRTLVVSGVGTDEEERVTTRARTENRPIGDLLGESLSGSIDWVVLGDLRADVLGGRALEALSEWVSESGGSLLCTGGPNALDAGGYGDTPLNALLPLAMEDRGGYKADQPSITLTEKGAQFIPFAAAMATTELPPLQGANRLGEPKAGATVLFDYSDTNSPAVAVHRFGLGQVMAFSGYGTWSWQMHLKNEQDSVSHGQFWRALVNYLQTEPGAVGIRIETDKKVYEQGQIAEVWVYMPASVGGAGRESVIDLSVIDPEGEVDPLALSLQSEKSGLYSGSYQFTKPGQYRFELIVGSNKFERSVGVEEPRREFMSLVQNSDLLKSIAAASGGTYFPLAEWRELVKAVPMVEQEHRQVRWVLWSQRPWMILFLLLLLAGEWFIRRRVGLP